MTTFLQGNYDGYRNMGDTYSEADSMSFHAQSVAASQVERTFSDVGSSLSTGQLNYKMNARDPTYCLMRIWLLIAEIHLGQGDLESAEFCASEAKQLAPHSYHVTQTRGLIEEAKGNYEDARQLFDDALAVNPFHSVNTFHLSRIYFQLKYNRLALNGVKIALRIDPYNENFWSFLGQIFDTLSKEMHDEAALFDIIEAPDADDDDQSDSDLSSNDPSEESGPYHRQPPEEEKATDHSRRREATLFDNYFLSTDGDESIRPEQQGEDIDCLANEMSKKAARAAECYSIALSLHNTGPIVPFNTISVAYD